MSSDLTERRRPSLPASPAVPVGRRMLFAERRRATLTVLGVACALLLVLVLRGIFAGAIDRVTYYIRTSPAEIFVSQSGVRTMHMSVSALPAASVDRVAAVPGVAWAPPIGFATGSVAGPAGRQPSYVIGYDTATGRGGPPSLEAGDEPTEGEAVLDQQAADQLGLGLGDEVTVLGTPLRVVGLSSDGTSITNTTVFVSAEQFRRMGHHDVSYILAGVDTGEDPAAVVREVASVLPDATVQTREEFADSESRVVEDMSADLLRLMSTIGLLIALAVIALGLMTATLSRIRDFAVLKAIGAATPRLAGTVALQVGITVALATAVATVLAIGLGIAAVDLARGPGQGDRGRRGPDRGRRPGRGAGGRPLAPAQDRPCRRRHRFPGGTMNILHTKSRPVASSANLDMIGEVGVQVRGLTKTYGDGETRVDAVHELDLDVHRGEVLLVMGPSGAGKTTLLLMLGALLRPTSGSIHVRTGEGATIDLALTPERQLPSLRAHTFGFIFQDYALLDALTATENIAVATNLAGRRGPAATARARDLLERVGLTHRAAARPSQMSGGEQQRVAVARALANDPPVLLADEPTANLDASRGRDLARLLRRLADEDRRSVVIVSHDDRLREVADRVLWLEDGSFKIVAGMVVDPVCRMLVEAKGPSWGHAGKTYWFCSDGCRREYVEDPTRFDRPAG